MKKRVLKVLKYALCVALIVGLFWLMSFAKNKQIETDCSGCEIRISRVGGVCIRGYDIQDWLNRARLKWNKGKVGEMNTEMLEHILGENPYVKDAQVYFTRDAKLHIDVKQKNPMLRLYMPSPFYMDEEGKVMPIAASHPFRLRVCSIEGEITDTLLSSVYDLEKRLRTDTLLNALIEQIYVDRYENFEMIPKVGHQRIVIGSIQDIEDKLQNLVLFYKKGMPQSGWDRYSIISLKYKGQVVCTKK